MGRSSCWFWIWIFFICLLVHSWVLMLLVSCFFPFSSLDFNFLTVESLHFDVDMIRCGLKLWWVGIARIILLLLLLFSTHSGWPVVKWAFCLFIVHWWPYYWLLLHRCACVQYLLCCQVKILLIDVVRMPASSIKTFKCSV